MKQTITFWTSVFVCVALLSGCLYPSGQRVENQVPYLDQIQAVQQAVNQYRQDHGVLPIATRDMDTPIYQKYPVDFRKLVPRYLQQPPGNSFENGGVFQYVLVNVEEVPEVKLADLSVMNELRQFQTALNQYMKKHTYAPVGEMVAIGIFQVDYEKLRYKEAPRVQSRYFGNYLPILLDNKGNIVIDYRIDLNMALQQYGHDFIKGEDIRSVLVDNSPFVPIFSIPYTIDENGEPTYMFTP